MQYRHSKLLDSFPISNHYDYRSYFVYNFIMERYENKLDTTPRHTTQLPNPTKLLKYLAVIGLLAVSGKPAEAQTSSKSIDSTKVERSISPEQIPNYRYSGSISYSYFKDGHLVETTTTLRDTLRVPGQLTTINAEDTGDTYELSIQVNGVIESYGNSIYPEDDSEGDRVQSRQISGVSNLPVSNSSRFDLVINGETNDNAGNFTIGEARMVIEHEPHHEIQITPVSGLGGIENFIAYGQRTPDSYLKNPNLVSNLQAVSAGLEEVRQMLNFAPVDTVGIIDNNEWNAFVRLDQANKAFVFDRLIEETDSAGVAKVARHEVLHLFAHAYGYNRNQEIVSIFREARSEIGTPSAGHNFFAVVNESDRFETIEYPAHSQDNVDELAASFLNIMFDPSDFTRNLGTVTDQTLSQRTWNSRTSFENQKSDILDYAIRLTEAFLHHAESLARRDPENFRIHVDFFQTRLFFLNSI